MKKIFILVIVICCITSYVYAMSPLERLKYKKVDINGIQLLVNRFTDEVKYILYNKYEVVEGAPMEMVPNIQDALTLGNIYMWKQKGLSFLAVTQVLI